MTSVTMQEAQANLPEIINRLQPGEEVVITDQGHPLAAVKKAAASPGGHGGMAAADVMALARTNQPSPDDETVRRWIEDFEDNLQVACAIESQCDAFVTRDPAATAGCPLAAVLPSQVVAQLRSSQ
jgi:antitoxin (DNA-binding transcriptional repressor) of toxin-antitoxin stability system